MTVAVYISALVIGLISSAHCIGMCGPISLALPIQTLNPEKRLSGLLLYNLGRICSYSVIGLFVGFIGRRIFLAGYQQIFSIVLGAIILLTFLIALFNKKALHLKAFTQLQATLQNFIAVRLKNKSMFASYLIGAANGFLPCGMVYFAITGAMATGSILSGILFMIAFGLGTMPVLLAFGYFGFFMNISFRNSVKRLTPFFFAGMAVFLILRGLNLGIPYVSPEFHNAAADAIPCHSN
jgi:sulfite exporter TauE/SafE